MHPSEAVEPGHRERGATVWEGHYSAKNFLGRMVVGGLLVLVWLFLAFQSWAPTTHQSGWSFWAFFVGLGRAGLLVEPRLSLPPGPSRPSLPAHDRRLFVTTGFFRRRVDQLELIRIKDVYIQQSMIGDWLGIGNVVVISSEQTLPKAHLLGIEEPRRIMDLIWHHLRAEQDKNTTRVSPL